MKRLFTASALILSVAIVLNSCSGGGGSSGFLPTTSGGGTGGTGAIVHSTTTTISGTVQLSSTVSTKPSSGTTYKAAATGSTMDKVLTAAGVKQAVSMPPLVNAAMKLYNADQPDWIYPVSQVFTDSLGRYKFDVLMNADLNGGGTAYVNGDPIPAGNYTVIATNDTTVSGGKQYVAVQTIVKRFEGDMLGNDLVVQDSDALPSVVFMLGLKPNSDGTFGASTAKLASNAGIQIIFSMAMARLSVMNAVKLYDKTNDPTLTTPQEGTWKFTPDLLTATFYPTGGMTTGNEYTVKIAGGFTNTTAAVNVYGKQLPASVTATFTADVADTTPPQNLMLLEPGSTNVPVTTPIMIGSPDEPIDINSMTVVGTPSIGDKPAVNYVGIKKVTIPIPVPHDVDYYIYQIGHTPLELAKNYSITISGVRDMAQNQISPLTFAFKTETTTAGIDPAATQDKQDRQLAVKDVFGKWMNAMNARNAAMLTTYMTGGFYWVPNGWSPYDLNRDGRLSLNEFRNQLLQMFMDFDHCQTSIDGNAETMPYIDITGNTASIQFHLDFIHFLPSAATDPVCTALGTGTGVMKADMENINSAWLISKGADDIAATYPPVLDVIELSAPPKGITLPEPTPSSPLNPDFVWTAISGISTYAVIITDAKSSETGWVGLVDGSAMNQGDQMNYTFSSNIGCIEPAGYDPTVGGPCSRFVMSSGGTLGFSKNISELLADGKYYWSVIGFKTATIDGTTGLMLAGNLADDLGASSQPFNFSVANDKGPFVIGTEPSDTTEGVSKNLAAVRAEFSEAMDPATIDPTTFYVTYADMNNSPVAGLNPSVSYDTETKTATLDLGGVLPDYSTWYRVHVTTGVRDSANPDGDSATHDGNRMDQEKTWTFKTEIAPDTTPPTTSANPAGGLYNSAQNVILTTDEAVQFIMYCTGSTCDPSTGTVYTGAITISTTTTLRFYASDLANPANDETVKTEVYTIDSVKPNVTASPAGGYYNATQIPVNITLSVDKLATIYYTTNGSDPTPSSPVYSSLISFTTDGTYALKFYAIDSAGNADQIHSEQYIVDTALPDTTITSTPQELTMANFANFTFMSNETTATFECKVDTASYTSCTNPYTVNTMEGAHTFSVRAVDAAGNKDATPATFAWTRDITPPAGSIRIDFGATPNATYATNTSVTLTVSATDNFSSAAEITMSFSNDNVFWTDAEPLAATKAWTLSSADGLKNVSVRFYDRLGNKSQYNDSIMLDTTPPNTSFTRTPPLISGTTVNIFEFSANEAAQGFECSMDGAGFTACPTPYTSAPLSDGSSHTFQVRAIDLAGLTDPTPASYTWSVDTTALVTTASPAGGQYNISQAPVNVTLTPTGIAPSCIGPPAPKTYWCEGSGCNPTTDYSLSTPSFNTTGTYTLRYYSVEQSSGSCTAPENESTGTGIKEQIFVLDLTAPTVNITGGPANPTNNNSASFSFNASESATFECDLDGGGYVACASPMNYVNLSDATHTFNVRAIDTAHNTGSPASFTWKIDTTPPYGGSIVINSNATYTNSTTVTLTMSASDASSTVASVLVSNDASAWTSYPYTGSPMNVSWSMPIGEGAKYVYVKFVDSVGNVSSMYSDGIILDTIVPDTYIYGAPANPTTARGSYFYFYASETATFQCSTNNGASWYACSNPTWVYQSYDGSYNFRVRATDSSGLTDAAPASYTWQIFTGYWDSPGLWDYSNWAN